MGQRKGRNMERLVVWTCWDASNPLVRISISGRALDFNVQLENKVWGCLIEGSSISYAMISAFPSKLKVLLTVNKVCIMLVAKQLKLSESDFGNSKVNTGREQTWRGRAKGEEAEGLDVEFRYLDQTEKQEDMFW